MSTFGKADGLFVPTVFTWNSTQFEGSGPVAGMCAPCAGGPKATIKIDNRTTKIVVQAMANRRRFVCMPSP
jgi:hypothetical protein